MSHLYGVLGIAASADRLKIKSAFRSLAKTCHPDMQGGDEVRFKAICQAYTILADPARRAAYDAACEAERAQVRAGSRRRWASALATMSASFTVTFSSGMALAGWLLGA